MGRKANILSYMEDYQSGWMNLHESVQNEDRVVRDILSYHEVAETRTNITAYVETLRGLVKDGKLDWKLGQFSGNWALAVR